MRVFFVIFFAIMAIFSLYGAPQIPVFTDLDVFALRGTSLVGLIPSIIWLLVRD